MADDDVDAVDVDDARRILLVVGHLWAASRIDGNIMYCLFVCC